VVSEENQASPAEKIILRQFVRVCARD